MAELELQVSDLRGGYGKKEVVHGLSFGLAAGDVLCLLGPNGCGKSTLLKLLLRFLPKTAGRIICRGVDVDRLSRRQMARYFAYIPQRDQAMFAYTALEMVTMARSAYLGNMQTPKPEDIEIAYDCLCQLKIQHLADFPYFKMSGGQRQLVLIARALCQKTCILMMDEPTASLDFANQQLINDAINELARAGKIVIVTTHNPAQPFAIASQVLLMREGQTLSLGPPQQVLTDESLEQVYGIPMQVVTITDRKQNQRSICLSV
ncbi:MAG: ABC transporter ATP-binding protein [Bacillota bacterium]|nr:ABC transporter ATP-binding protein [Bacillota bacterium]